MDGNEIGAPGAGNYASVHGLEMYYEVHGEGEPLILLHGGLGAIEMFGDVLPLLGEGRRVIGVDLQAHGGTADVDRPMTTEAMADDVAALIGHLGLEEADVMGYSLGGGVALQTAIPRPCVRSSSSRHRSSATDGTLGYWPGWSRWAPRPPSP